MQCSNCGNDLRSDTKFCTKCGALNPHATTHAPAAPSVPPPTLAGSFGDGPRPQFGGSQMGGPQKKSGCGKVLLILAGVGVLGLVAIGIASYYGYKFAETKLKSSEAYTVAVAALKQSPAVAEQLGEIKETGFPLGSFNENADGSGTAAYRMSVAGTKANGQYDVVLRRRQRKWALITGRVTLANGDVVNVKSAGIDVLTGDAPDANDNTDETMPPPPPAPPGTTTGRIISGGVLNGKAISKPEPAYPPIAKAVHAAGTVTVQVVVDETGKVISAQAVSGHPLLQQAAATAAKQARFTPTLVSGRPVKVSGTITYNFDAQ
jgi:TonB family protein